MRFEDRQHAGRLLAARLEHLRDDHPIVLGLTGGGMPVAFEVAHALGAPLDLVVVRKLHATTAPELPFGALAEGGVTYLNPTVMRDARMRHEDTVAVAEGIVAELARHVRLYRGQVPAPNLRGRVVIIVDDFVVTGTSARAAALAARKRGAERVVFAVPVLASEIARELRADLDDLVVLELTDRLRLASDAYARFEEGSDTATLEFLRRARLERVDEGISPSAMT
jgi:putative phosphoribosyl transferase